MYINGYSCILSDNLMPCTLNLSIVYRSMRIKLDIPLTSLWQVVVSTESFSASSMFSFCRDLHLSISCSSFSSRATMVAAYCSDCSCMGIEISPGEGDWVEYLICSNFFEELSFQFLLLTLSSSQLLFSFQLFILKFQL